MKRRLVTTIVLLVLAVLFLPDEASTLLASIAVLGVRSGVGGGPSGANPSTRVLTGDTLIDGTGREAIPDEEPSRFSLAVSLKTAGALGLAVPPSMRLRADRVRE